MGRAVQRRAVRDLGKALADGLARRDAALLAGAAAYRAWLARAWGGDLPASDRVPGGPAAALELPERLYVAECCAALVALASAGGDAVDSWIEEAGEDLGALLGWAVRGPWRARAAACLTGGPEPMTGLALDVAQGVLLELLPPPDRRAIGLHPTPPWAAEQVMAHLAPLPDAGTVLDPAAGTGVFLSAALSGLWEQAGRSRGAAVWTLAARIVGVETSPLLAAAAAGNLVRVARALAGQGPPAGWRPRVLCADLLCDLRPGANADFGIATRGGTVSLPRAEIVVGNPPWVAWDRLSEPYKEKLAQGPLRTLDAFSLRGFEARLGGATDDLSLLFVLLGLRDLVRPGGRLSFLLKWNLISNEAARVLRRFEVRTRPREDAPGPAAEAVPFALERLVDLRAANPFRAAVEPALFVFRRDTPMGDSVPAARWVRRGRGAVRVEPVAPYVPLRSAEPEGPWAPASAARTRSASLEGVFGWTIRQGLKHDCNGVFLLEVLGRGPGGLLRVRNLPELSRRIQVAPWEGLLESQVVRPLIQSRHLRPFVVTGWRHVLLPVRGGRVVDAETLAAEAPRAYAYLEANRVALGARRSKVFAAPPFYRVFGYGPYCEAPAQVIWSGMAFRPWFAAVDALADPWLGRVRPVVDSACYLVPCGTLEEAHYLSGLLGSAPVRTFLRARSSGSKRGLGRATVKHLGLPAFRPEDPAHRALAAEAARLTRVGPAEADRSPARGGAGAAATADPTQDASRLDALAQAVLGGE